MNAILEMRGISKNFTGVKALSDVSLAVEHGEIHALCGENGAGKSTLMKVLSGVHPHGSYEGQILYEGVERQFRDINDSEALGIIIIHQELALIPLLSIAENIFLSAPPSKYGVIDRDEVWRRSRELLAKVGLNESPDTLVTNIGVGKQQLVEIAKALSKDVKLLILDEPTASLNETDSAALLDLLVEFREQGISSVLISHKLNEVSRVADRITVLRDGRSVDTNRQPRPGGRGGPDHPQDGRSRPRASLPDAHARHRRGDAEGRELVGVPSDPCRAASHPQRRFRGPPGEIVGIAGLMGAGRTEFAMSLFGRSYGRKITGRATVNGRERDLSTVSRAIDAGLAYVTEDRKALGLLLAEDIRKNVTLSNLDGVSHGSVIDDIAELKVANDYRSRMRIRSSSVYQETGKLSRRQPAEGGAVEMAVHRSRGADPGRADARHRCRRQVRDLCHHPGAGRCGKGGGVHLVGNARAARRVRPHLRDERGPLRR